jgi:endonuclease/exonuclease/phosphatase family metal-dependent hydrolase
MTRIVSYNILAGGYSVRENSARRTEQLVKIIRSAQPDVVGLVEAVNPHVKAKVSVIEEMAQILDMQLITSGELESRRDYAVALLTRLPVIHTKIHKRPGVLARPLLEVCVQEESGEHLTVFVTHLSAAFNRGRAGGHIRLREVAEILRILEPFRVEGKPHLLMGDFNSLAPGEPFKASYLLRYVLGLDINRKPQQADGHPHLNGVVPPSLRFLNPLLRLTARNQLLSNLFDGAAYFYAPRACIRDLKAHYVDCFHRQHPHEWGFTCPAGAPAGRIDYIFASGELADRLEDCYIITEGEGLPGSQASDHLAVSAAFGVGVRSALETANVQCNTLSNESSAVK